MCCFWGSGGTFFRSLLIGAQIRALWELASDEAITGNAVACTDAIAGKADSHSFPRQLAQSSSNPTCTRFGNFLTTNWCERRSRSSSAARASG